MTIGNDMSASGSIRRNVVALVELANRIVRSIAYPDLVQLVLRLALAVPFWKSGMLKWDGFLRVNDTAITLFTDEFMLHLPGGPYPFPRLPPSRSSRDRAKSSFRSCSSSASPPALPHLVCWS